MCILLLSDFLFMGKVCIWYTFVLKNETMAKRH
nr:MAG TPA: hypothetical protein [Caudoviricetes sp.]